MIPCLAVALLVTSCNDSSSSGVGPGSNGGQNEAPSTTIRTPFTGNSFTEDEEVLLEGMAVDPEEGMLVGSSLVWSSDVDGEIGTGVSVATRLSLGFHEISLVATDSGGAVGTDTVTIRIAELAQFDPRPGSVNPYAGRVQRTPVKQDDELILIGRSSSLDQMVLGIVEDPLSDATTPYFTGAPSGDETRITARSDLVVPMAASAGRVLGSNLHQAAIVTRTSGPNSQFKLEIFGLVDPGEDVYAEYAFLPPFPDGVMDVLVADLDAFEETVGRTERLAPCYVNPDNYGLIPRPPCDVNSDYNDEVVLAYPELVNGEPLVRIEVLSFEDVEFPEEENTPIPGPTSVTMNWTTERLHPSSRIVLHLANDVLSNNRLHLVVAYINEAKQVALDLFELEHTRTDFKKPDPLTDSRSLNHVLHATITDSLSDTTVAAGGWDVAIARRGQMGLDGIDLDVAIVVHNDAGGYAMQVWSLEALFSSPEGPKLIGMASGEFARARDLASGNEVVLTMLPDTSLRVELGRILDSEASFSPCDAIGLYVLADTNRGAVVQVMAARTFNECDSLPCPNIFIGPITEHPFWPSSQAVYDSPETHQTTRVSMATGGFVSERNAVVTFNSCPNAGIGSLVGSSPSLFVSDPEASELHTIQGGLIYTDPLDPSLDERSILIAADATGDAAYYSATVEAGPTQARQIWLGEAELHYFIENIETANILLGVPPKHVDHLPALGGIVDISMRNNFFAEFAQVAGATGSVTRKAKTDWTVGGRGELGLGPPVPKGTEFSSAFDISLDLEHSTTQEQFSSSQVAVSLTQTTGAIDDDVVWCKRQTIDFWRYPAMGGRQTLHPSSPSGFPDDAYLEVAIPNKAATLIGPGTLNENYQPNHTVGNILSYPSFSGTVTDIGDLFGFLGSYVPSDENGGRRCKPLEGGLQGGCLVKGVGDILMFVSTVFPDQEYVGGVFESVTNPIDVAELLQVGGITYSAELSFETAIQNGQTVTSNDKIKGEGNLKIPLSTGPVTKVPLQFGEAKLQLRADASFENARISENTMNSKEKVSLHLPSDIPVERSYQIRPSYGFTSGGAMKIAYQVNTTGVAGTFWHEHYGGPDPALNMPHRIVRTPEGFRLGTDFSRSRIKGFFVRDGQDIDPFDPGAAQGFLLTEVPQAGDPVQLQVQVANLSVGTSVEDLDVLFSVQVLEDGQPTGNRIPLGTTTIDYLPYRGLFPDASETHIGSAYLLWDTTGYGPSSRDSLTTYLVHVTLDPSNAIPDETHELLDRYGDPLRGPLGDALDPELEKGQNNTGWAMVRIAAALRSQKLTGGRSAVLRAQRSTNEIQMNFGEFDRLDRSKMVRSRRGPDQRQVRQRIEPIRGQIHEPIRLRVELQSDDLLLDHGLLQVFDSDPLAGGQMILSRTVQGISSIGVTQEDFIWRPRTAGKRVLHAIYTGSEADYHPAMQIPVIIED